MKTNIHFWSYLAQFLLQWEMFQIKVVQKIKTHFVFNNFSFKSYHLWDNVENGVGPGRTHDNIKWRMRFCMQGN